MRECVYPDFQSLQFVFTEQDFYPDIQAGADSAEDEWDWHNEKDRFRALYQLGFEEKKANITVTANYLYNLVSAFFECLTSLPELELAREQAEVRLSEDQMLNLFASVPFAVGSEYITEEWINRIIGRLKEQFADEISAYNGTVAMYLAGKTQRLSVPERIYFHLVEQKDEAYPFAFLATYATKEENGELRHMPLKYALTEYKDDKNRLLALLSCLNRASEVSSLISEFMCSGELFHPLRLTSDEACRFLKDVEAIEATGILCRIPNWWKKKSMCPSMTLKLGGNETSMLGFDTIVSLQPELVVEGESLSEEDIRSLLEQSEGLALIKGKWVEVDHKKLRELLKQMERYPRSVSLKTAIQMELGETVPDSQDVSQITNGEWLSELFANLRKPERMRSARTPRSINAVLRPYQKAGYTWLSYMDTLGFGACLADDMGLGKTLEVLTYLERLRVNRKNFRALLIVPASLLGNWQSEIKKFAPQMDVLFLHGKGAPVLEEMFREKDAFLTITTYGMAMRMEALKERTWDCIVLDEAQAIKNPGTKQTRSIKKIPAKMRIAMTGTPIENDLTNLWSLFDFLNQGLLGTSKEFRGYCKNLKDHPEGYQKLKAMISPFMLRRVKTDKRIIKDLPEKFESVTYVPLTKKQVVLYRDAVADMEAAVNHSEGIKRRGIILATITKLKQICNHPDQYLGQSAFRESESGKLQVLREICKTIYEKRERVLVFTQFREITEPLAAFLKGVFGMDGYVLHGGTPIKKRNEMVEAFQGENYVPFMVISLKAGGTGLNLTKANHVIHFDRWWNPAVEEQATDRTFRIGQKKNVIVHKLVCQGTIEEKIDAIMNEKTKLFQDVIGNGTEQWITELDNEELMELFRLEQ